MKGYEHKKPELRDFGITSREYALFEPTRGPSGKVWLFTCVLLFLGIFILTGDVAASLFVGLLATPFVVYLVDWVIVRSKRYRLGKPHRLSIKQFQEALVAYYNAQQEAEIAQREAERAAEWAKEEANRLWRKAERAKWEAERPQREAAQARRRKASEHWMSLSGPEFERELATLYRHLGYRVESTPSSGDQGIDLVLRKGGKTTIVQCKGHQAPVGPAIARELFGAMVAFGADDAILACTGGFTRGVKEFVRGKPIDLISASDLAVLGERAEGKPLDRANIPPFCPRPNCGREMVPRVGRSGRFWGCPRYPRCRGYRRRT